MRCQCKFKRKGRIHELLTDKTPIKMGTRFMCTVEAPIHNNIKEQIVKAQETDTALVLRRWKNTTRLYRNKVTDQALKVEKESTTGEFSEIAPFVSGQRGRQVFINGDPEYGVSFCYGLGPFPPQIM